MKKKILTRTLVAGAVSLCLALIVGSTLRLELPRRIVSSLIWALPKLFISYSSDSELNGRAGLQGTVMNFSGEPIDGAYVSTFALPASAETTAFKARTNAAGHFVFRNLEAPGSYELGVVAPGHVSWDVDWIPMKRGRMADLPAIQLAAAGRIAGKVVDSAGKPAPGVDVEAGPPGWYNDAQANGGDDIDIHAGVTNTDGTFVIDYIDTSGLFDIYAMVRDKEDRMAEEWQEGIRVRSGHTTSVSITLGPMR